MCKPEALAMGLDCCELWLTPEEKTHRLQALAAEIDGGHVDLSLVPYLQRLNQVEWLCTAQSCQGHEPYGTAVKCLGYISFRVALTGWGNFLKGLAEYEREWPGLGWLGVTVEGGGAHGPCARFEVWWDEPTEWRQRVETLCRVFGPGGA